MGANFVNWKEGYNLFLLEDYKTKLIKNTLLNISQKYSF